MNKSDYDKYYKKGGTYVIPVEVFNELFDELDKKDNIINELEKWLDEKIYLNKNDKDYINGMTFVGVNLQMYQMFLDKLQELKGSDVK